MRIIKSFFCVKFNVDIYESGRITIKRHALLLASSVLLFNVLVACNSQQQQNPGATTNHSSTQEQNSSGNLSSVFPSSILADSLSIDSVNEYSTIRAELLTDKGTLLMISNGREERGHLIVSSTLGQEGDQTFQSNYSIVYREGEQDTVLLELPAYLFVQPSDNTLSFEKTSFKEAEVYVLTPQYQTGHGLEGYAFAVSKHSGEAFPLEIIHSGHVSKTLLYSELESFPTVENNRLIVHPPIGAGTPDEDAKAIHYRLDLSNKQLVAE
ncbi:hypothetical protein [Paenibacillus agri]|uniref:Uncharacterized protein n=1 Tax=Paenibacillus agri TaxID=2744309 RepID=A0A850EDL4_9BACL|nr:hypothetical protein [Paenibacillus agri]NUU59353.1 hypothetical protein [Paenibacillus agri]